MTGLELRGMAVAGVQPKAPCGGEYAEPSPADRRKGGLKRPMATEGYAIPSGITSAGAHHHDFPLRAPTWHAAATQLSGVLPDHRACHLNASGDSYPAQSRPEGNRLPRSAPTMDSIVTAG